MPTNPFDVPLGLGDVTWRKGTENTATTASDPATAKTTLTATELVTEVNWSYTLEEDSIIALMPAIRARLGISGAALSTTISYAAGTAIQMVSYQRMTGVRLRDLLLPSPKDFQMMLFQPLREWLKRKES